MWGAYTNYWRTRGSFNLSPTAPTPYYDLSVVLPTLRTRSWTLGQMVTEIQYMLLENPSGIAGTGMSGQITVSAILQAIQLGRNRWIQDVLFPVSVHTAFLNPPPPTGMVPFSQNSVFVHRAGWQDLPGGVWSNLWRQDAWAADKSNQLWTLAPGMPLAFSEAENAPLQLQLIRAPLNEGNLEAITVDSLQIDTTVPGSLFGVPDEWVHGIKYAALSYLLNGEGEIKDVMRGEYAEQRYTQAVSLAKDARSVIRLLCNGVPLQMDTLTAMDAGNPYWRNQSGAPQVAGAIYDVVAINPGIPDQAYGMMADVVQSAPLPNATIQNNSNDYIQLGLEDLDHLTDYVTHLLVFKCGGTDFKSTMPSYDSFMSTVAGRKAVNAADIQYMTPLFAQAQREQQQRPDRAQVRNA